MTFKERGKRGKEKGKRRNFAKQNFKPIIPSPYNLTKKD